jgi:hypothetical protein
MATAEQQPLPHELICSICGRAWSAATDDKWPIQVLDGDPPRAVAHCLVCAERGAGYEARGCATRRHPQAASIHNGNGAGPADADRLEVVRTHLADRTTFRKVANESQWGTDGSG